MKNHHIFRCTLVYYILICIHTLSTFFCGSLFLHICLQAQSLLHGSLIRKQSHRSDLEHAFFAGLAESISHEHLHIA